MLIRLQLMTFAFMVYKALNRKQHQDQCSQVHHDMRSVMASTLLHTDT